MKLNVLTVVVTRENCSTITLREPYQDKIHREKCLLPTPVSTPVNNNGTLFPEEDPIPLGLPVLTNSEKRQKRNQSVYEENRSDSPATKMVRLSMIFPNI